MSKNAQDILRLMGIEQAKTDTEESPPADPFDTFDTIVEERKKKPGLLKQVAGVVTELPAQAIAGGLQGLGHVSRASGRALQKLDEAVTSRGGMPTTTIGRFGEGLEAAGEGMLETTERAPVPETAPGVAGRVAGSLVGGAAPYVAAGAAAPVAVPFLVRTAIATAISAPITAMIDAGDPESSTAAGLATILETEWGARAYERMGGKAKDRAAALRELTEDPVKTALFGVAVDAVIGTSVDAAVMAARAARGTKRGPGPIGQPPKTVPTMSDDEVLAMPVWRNLLDEPESVLTIRNHPTAPAGHKLVTYGDEQFIVGEPGLLDTPVTPIGPERQLRPYHPLITPPPARAPDTKGLRPTGSNTRMKPIEEAAEVYLNDLIATGAPPHEIEAARRLARIHPRVTQAPDGTLVDPVVGPVTREEAMEVEGTAPGISLVERVFRNDSTERLIYDVPGSPQLEIMISYDQDRPTSLFVDWVGARQQLLTVSQGVPVLGVKGIRTIMTDLARIFPEARYIEGERITGARTHGPQEGGIGRVSLDKYRPKAPRLQPPEKLFGAALTPPAHWQGQVGITGLKTELQNGEYGILTALDPRHPMEVTLREGESPSQRLVGEIKKMGYEEWDIIPMTGTYQGQPQGTSFIVRGMTAEDAIQLGRMFGQEEVISNEGMIQVATGAVAPRTGSVIVGDDVAGHEFFSTLWHGDQPMVNFTVNYNFEQRIPLADARAQTQLVLYRYQPDSDPLVSPANPKVRTGVSGREDPRRLNDPAAFMPRTNWYLSEGFAEPGVKQMPFLHRGQIGRGRMYDIVADPEHFVGSWNTQTGLDPATYLEKAVAAAGYAGMYDPTRGVAAVFEDVLTEVRTNPLLADKAGATTQEIVRAIAQGGSGALAGGTVGALGAEEGKEVEGFFKGALVGTLAAAGLSAPGRQFVVDIASKNPVTQRMAEQAQRGLKWVLLPQGNAPEQAHRASWERDARLGAAGRIVQMRMRQIKAAKPTAGDLDEIARIANNVPARRAVEGWARRTFLTMQMPAKLKREMQAILDSDPLPARIDRLIGDLWEENVITDPVLFADMRTQLRRLANQPRDFSTLPPNLRDPVRSLVADMDAMRQELVHIGAVQGEMLTVFDLNSDVYLTRGYAHFDNPEAWKDFVNPGPNQPFYKMIWNKLRGGDGQRLYNDAVLWVRNRYPTMSAVEAQNMVTDMLQVEDSPFAMMARLSPTTRSKVNVLRRRGDVPEVIRRLWGEYDDPLVQLSQSHHSLAAKLEHYKFIDDLRRTGNGVFVFDKRNRPDPSVQETVPVTAEGNPNWRPLDGMFVTPEIMQLLQGHKQIENSVWRWIVAGNALARVSKTVGSWVTQVRNVVGGHAFLSAQGYLANPVSLSRALSRGYSLGKATVAGTGEQVLGNWGYGAGMPMRQYMADLIRRGVFDQNPVSKEIDALKIDVWGRRLASMGAGIQGLTPVGRAARAAGGIAKDIVETPQDVYRATDDVFKATAFEMEFERLMPILNDRNAAAAQAATAVRGVLPNYSMISPGVKALRRFPIFGSFVSFNYEMYRTVGNTLKTAQEEMASPDIRIKKIGATRLAGFVGTVLAAPTAALASKHMFGVTQEEENESRYLLPYWSENSNVIWLPRDTEGNRRYIDASYTDPYGVVNKMIPMILRGEGGESVARRSVMELGYQFFGEELFWEALRASTMGPRAPSIKDQGSAEWFRTFSGALLDAVEPAVYEQVARVVQGQNNASMGDFIAGKPATRTLDRRVEALALATGTRISTLKPAESLKYELYDFEERIAKAQERYRRYQNTVEQIDDVEMKKIARDFLARSENISTQYRRKVEAAIRLGVPSREVRDLMKYSVREPKIREYLLGNTEWPFGVAP